MRALSWLWRISAPAALAAGIATAALVSAGCENDGPIIPGASGGAAATGSGSGASGGATGSGTDSGSGATGTDSGSGATGSGASSGSSTEGTGGTSMGSGGTGTGTGGAAGSMMAQQVPDFELIDVNPNSLTSGQPVSPRDYLQRVSAWYFGHST